MIAASQLPFDHSLVVSEVFGPTFQGEGPAAGRVAGFIRLGGCNLRCHWCDSPYTWDGQGYDLRQELERRSIADLHDDVRRMGVKLVIITGGEPLLQQKHLAFSTLLTSLQQRGMAIHFETSGTIAPSPSTIRAAELFIVSPKLANSGMAEERRVCAPALEAFKQSRKAAFKFVCQTPDDVDEASAFVVAHELPRDKIWIMPEGISADGITATLRNLAARAIAHRFNITNRLHVQLWGNERSR